MGPGIWCLEAALIDDEPKAPASYKASLPESVGVVHATIEVHEKAPPGGEPDGASVPE